MAQTSFSGPVFLGAFTVATAPEAKIGSVAYFQDGAGGAPVLAYYDGTDWRRCDTRDPISD